jgi:hypothetical protein
MLMSKNIFKILAVRSAIDLTPNTQHQRERAQEVDSGITIRRVRRCMRKSRVMVL